MSEHREVFAQLVGDWEGTARTWFEPDQLTDESSVRGSIHRLGNTRFLVHEYEGKFGADPRSGIELIGLPDGSSANGVVAWVDTFHMSDDVLLSSAADELAGADPARAFSVLGSYAAGPPGPDTERWGWRTTYEVVDADHVTITAWNIMPSGEEARATEVVYTRRV